MVDVATTGVEQLIKSALNWVGAGIIAFIAAIAYLGYALVAGVASAWIYLGAGAAASAAAMLGAACALAFMKDRRKGFLSAVTIVLGVVGAVSLLAYLGRNYARNLDGFEFVTLAANPKATKPELVTFFDTPVIPVRLEGALHIAVHVVVGNLGKDGEPSGWRMGISRPPDFSRTEQVDLVPGMFKPLTLKYLPDPSRFTIPIGTADLLQTRAMTMKVGTGRAVTGWLIGRPRGLSLEGLKGAAVGIQFIDDTNRLYEASTRDFVTSVQLDGVNGEPGPIVASQ